jgi:hypothetical protein
MDIEGMLRDLESDIEQAELDLKIAKDRLARIVKELKEGEGGGEGEVHEVRTFNGVYFGMPLVL